MSMTDPIADLLTRIRNAQSAGKPTVGVGASKLKLAILKVLKDEGYIGSYNVETAGAKSTLSIELKYHDGRPVIDRIDVWRRGAVALWLGETGITVESTNETRGDRPWVPHPRPKRQQAPVAEKFAPQRHGEHREE